MYEPPDTTALKHMINHMFLPPQLPQTEDETDPLELVKLTADSLKAFRQHLTDQDQQDAVDKAIAAVLSILDINHGLGKGINELALLEKIRGLKDGYTIAMNIAAQNAAIMITREADKVIFESFELSPPNETVMTATGRLTRTFPAKSIALSAERLQGQDFAQVIASTSAKMSSKVISQMEPVSIKSGKKHEELRDTNDPFMVSGVLLGALQAFAIPARVISIMKQTRDDVLWNQTLLPWRRSPMWLLLKVCIHLITLRASNGSHELYKQASTFALSRVLQLSQGRDISEDLMYCMGAKISRRLLKQEQQYLIPDDHTAFHAIQGILEMSHKTLSKAWSETQSTITPPCNLAQLKKLNFQQGTGLSIPSLDKHIADISTRIASNATSNYLPVSQAIKYPAGQLPTLLDKNYGKSKYAVANLQEFETWVANHIQSFVSAHDYVAVPSLVRPLISQYHNIARTVYSDNPEGISIMFLTIFELWIACDKAAIKACKLLADYACGISLDTMSTVVLPDLNQMKRLAAVEAYLTRRASGNDTKLLFAEKDHRGLANRFYDQSQSHRECHDRILAQARIDREQKRIQYRTLKQQYEALMEVADSLSCEYVEVVVDSSIDPPETETRHSRSCRKCNHIRRATSVTIDVHEWPLPSDNKWAKTVVFELEVPQYIAEWRCCRAYLLCSVLKGQATKLANEPGYGLGGHGQLAENFKQAQADHITLRSQTKPASVTHYKEKCVGTIREDDACVPNGLALYYHDTLRSARPDGVVVPHAQNSMACTYKVNSGNLKSFIHRPSTMLDGQPPNVVYADQDHAPSSLSLEQYKDLTGISHGCYLQWVNMIREIAMCTIDMKSTDTLFFFLQCMYQSGPPDNDNDVRRRSHAILMGAHAHWALKHVEQMLSSVKPNWECDRTLFMLSAMSARLLTLNTNVDALRVLADIRSTARCWVELLQEKAYKAENDADRKEFQERTLLSALICVSTFDVDLTHLEQILFNASDSSLLIQMAVIIHDSEPNVVYEKCLERLLRLRFSRLLGRSYRLMRSTFAMNTAVKRLWSTFTPTASWSIKEIGPEHWMECRTAATDKLISSTVHLDLLTGELLVNGAPMDQPPREYRKQDLYRLLFGGDRLTVLPAKSVGFRFSIDRIIQQYEVELGVDDSGKLVVKATDSESTLETISFHHFKSLLPAHFVHDFIHWYDHRSDTVIFRDSKDPWRGVDESSWQLSRSARTNLWTLGKGSKSVNQMSSSTSKLISEILHPLAQETHIHCIFDSSSSFLEIELPRLSLNFYLAEQSDSLRSREYPDMTVDATQDIGTLVGLVNKLCLRSTTDSHRRVLVPNAGIKHSRHKEHTQVTISKESASKFHAFYVDEQLQCLKDQGDTESKLVLAYLHALTSHILPDPLLKKTGVEQALDILDSAALRSFDRLTQEDLQILTCIAMLSPRREFYPPNMRRMQTVTWDQSLGFLVQHELLVMRVIDILAQAEELTVFAKGNTVKVPRIPGDPFLRRRSLLRSASVRVSGYGADLSSCEDDVAYQYRSRGDDRNQATTKISCITKLLATGRESRCSDGVLTVKLWSMLQKVSTVYGMQSNISLGYDHTLLEYATGTCHCLRYLPSMQQWLQNVEHRQQRPFGIVMVFATLAAAPTADMPLLEALGLFALGNSFDHLPPLSFVSTDLSRGLLPRSEMLTTYIQHTRRPLNQCPEAHLTRGKRETLKAFDIRQNDAWQKNRKEALRKTVKHLVDQWPNQQLTPFKDSFAERYIDMVTATDSTQRLFNVIHQNIELKSWTDAIDQTISTLPISSVSTIKTIVDPAARLSVHDGFISQNMLFTQAAPRLQLNLDLTTQFTLSRGKGGDKASRLPSVLRAMRQHDGTSKFQVDYLRDLDERHTALPLADQQSTTAVRAMDLSDLEDYHRVCSEQVECFYKQILEQVVTAPGYETCQLTFQVPRVSPSFFLKQLSRKNWSKLNAAWRSAIVDYGIALTTLQRADRLLKTFDRPELFNAELGNRGHENWDAIDFPETLLVEIESNILIRQEQEIVAAEMRSPSINQNIVTQLNMGAGKSSTIIPIVAAFLSTGQQLVRVIVGKPQSKQMAQMLISKLGGLVNRRVAYMPVSRSLQFSECEAHSIRVLLQKYTEEGTILLLQPEHILSFKLMVPECYLAGRLNTGKALTASQDFLESTSRDLVDESDENFSVKFELVYTHGKQQLIDGAPERWLIAQQVLDVVQIIASEIHKEHSHHIELATQRPGRFPRMRILNEDAAAILNRGVTKYICTKGLESANLGRFPADIRASAYTYIAEERISQEQIDAIEKSSIWTEHTKRYLYLLRGVVAGGILSFVFSQKRWRVNYGLTDRRPTSQLAVPYSAKDRPSLRSEFSHPDVAIMFTLLSYYYGGISTDNMFAAFKHLMISDGADTIYDRWTQYAVELRPAFKKLTSVNLNDGPQCRDKLFPMLRNQKSVIDYFVANLVFTKESKDFPQKLSASGWDIGKMKVLPTTGFSGTNDSRLLLPLDVKHIDLESQKATNALVLEHLLMADNLVSTMQEVNVSSVAKALLDMVVELQPPVQVILDVGAQVIEMSNLDFAKQWLRRHSATKEAVIYVDDSDEICIVDRQHRQERFQTSSFASRPDSCLVYLDECHTRGIDLRLPRDYRAAVTLGTKLTKDRLVQACMRMRQLGHGQTLTFIVPTEIVAKIQAMPGYSGNEIQLEHIVRWTINETFFEINRSMPLWAKQGQRFVANEKIWTDCMHEGTSRFTKEHAGQLLEQEAMTIEERYAPRSRDYDDARSYTGDNPRLMEIATRCQGFNDQGANSSTLQEEQERELAPEMEIERQVQKPPSAKATKHQLHNDVVAFALRGTYRAKSEAYLPAFHTLKHTSAANGFDPMQFSNAGQLLVTKDFAQVVEADKSDKTFDSYQRNVQWLITSRRAQNNQVERLLIISPFEANQLLPQMRDCKNTALHGFKARSNATFDSMEKLDFFVHPPPRDALSALVLSPQLETMLVLFSGQLYLSSYSKYLELCKYIGVCPSEVTEEMATAGFKTDPEGFILSDEYWQVGGSSGLRESPLECLRTYLGKVRRNGENCNKTHLGMILRGGVLREEDFKEKA